MDKKQQHGNTASLKRAVKYSDISSAAKAKNTAFKYNKNIDNDSTDTEPEDMSTNGNNDEDTSPHSSPFTKDSISAEKCSQLTAAKKLPSPHGSYKRPATVAAQIFDVECKWPGDADNTLQGNNRSFGDAEGAMRSLDEMLSLGNIRGDKDKGKGV